MCIIAYKEKGINGKIDWDVLETCFINNPDGAGYSLAYNDTLIIRKGFMQFEDLKASLTNAVKGKKLVDCGILLHFRITTHGGTNRENTHPFPIGHNDMGLRKYKDLPASVAMNGICLSNMGYRDALSDTADAVKNVVNPLYRICGNFWQNENAEQLFDFLGAKWAILEKNGKVYSFGEFNQSAGWHYSNYSYLSYTYSSYKSPSYMTSSCYSNSYYSTSDKIQPFSHYLDYHSLGLKPFKGYLENTETLDIVEITYNDDYYIDDENFIYCYDWQDDDYYIIENYTVLQDETHSKAVM